MKLNKDKLTMMSGALLLTLALTAFGSSNAPTANANAGTQEIDANQCSELFGGNIEDFEVEVTIEETITMVNDNGDEVVVEENRYILDENGNEIKVDENGDEIKVDENGSESTEDED